MKQNWTSSEHRKRYIFNMYKELYIYIICHYDVALNFSRCTEANFAVKAMIFVEQKISQKIYVSFRIRQLVVDAC